MHLSPLILVPSYPLRARPCYAPSPMSAPKVQILPLRKSKPSSFSSSSEDSSPKGPSDESSPETNDQPLVKQKRASKPKVRTGCQTCKYVGPYRFVTCKTSAWMSTIDAERLNTVLPPLIDEPCGANPFYVSSRSDLTIDPTHHKPTSGTRILADR